MFSAMSQVCHSELDKVAQQREEEGDEQIEYGEVFNDFATEDFVNKNIRVRPISGLAPDETKDGRQSNVSRGMDDQGGDAEDNFNKMAALEMDTQRKNIKAVLQKKLDDAAKKLAAEEAKKKKKIE